MLQSLSDYIKNKYCLSAGLLFVVNAIAFANWAVRLPYIKDLLQISDRELGLALLASPLGVIIISTITPSIIRKYGTGNAAFFFGMVMSTVLCGFAWIDTYTNLCIALFAFGLSHGALDIATNGYVTAIEKKFDIVIMSTSHGFWSLGSMLGALFGSLILGSTLSYEWHMILNAMLVAIILISQYPIITQIVDTDEQQTKMQLPGYPVLLLAAFVFIVFIIEGAIADWSAIYYDEILNSPPHLIGIGFAAFCGAMALFRFAGDKIILRYNQSTILILSSIVIGLCLILFSLSTDMIASTLLMVVIGTFCSVLVPIVFRAASRIKGNSASTGIAFVSALGYGGFLIGPPGIGLISDKFGLPSSFLMLGSLMFLAALLGYIFKSLKVDQ